MYFRFVLLAAFVLSSVGCAHETHAWFTRTRSIHRPPKKDRGHVRILTAGRPQRPHIDIGLITAQAQIYHNVLYYAQKLAAKIGCDAILPAGTNVIPVSASGAYGQVNVRSVVRGRFSCLVWR